MITLDQFSGGRDVISPRSMVTRGSASSAAVTDAANPSRSTAKAAPAGTRCSSAARDDQRAETAHFLVQQADGIGLMII